MINWASATSVPNWSAPLTTSEPPTPYTTAVNSAVSRVIPIISTDPYMSLVTPISRTWAALDANSADSSRGRPNSLASIAPATLNRSVIVEPISALSCIASLDSRCSLRPTSRTGIRNSGISASAMRLTTQDR